MRNVWQEWLDCLEVLGSRSAYLNRETPLKIKVDDALSHMGADFHRIHEIVQDCECWYEESVGNLPDGFFDAPYYRSALALAHLFACDLAKSSQFVRLSRGPITALDQAHVAWMTPLPLALRLSAFKHLAEEQTARFLETGYDLALLSHRLVTHFCPSCDDQRDMTDNVYQLACAATRAAHEGQLQLTSDEQRGFQKAIQVYEAVSDLIWPSINTKTPRAGTEVIYERLSSDVICLVRQGIIDCCSLFELSDRTIEIFTWMEPAWRNSIDRTRLISAIREAKERFGGFDPVTAQQKEHLLFYLDRQP